jgi:predicted O-methyltransferase YrrM
MNKELWSAVDRYINDLFIPFDPVLDAALKASAEAGLPPISVTPSQGKLLNLLAQTQGANKILEIGTLGGYSTIWLARALPSDGHLITLENNPKHAEIARANIERAGLSGIVELRLGPALETLPRLVAENCGPFDMVFIDANKAGYPDYFLWSMKLISVGSLIIADNVVRRGEVANPKSDDPSVKGVRRFHELMAADPRVSVTVMQTVGSKGYDGFTIARVIAGQ